MPLFDNDSMEQKIISGSSGFQYSATRPDKLGETDYTLVTIAIDFSYSTIDFTSSLLKMLKFCLEACMSNPRKRNILVRVICFSDTVREIHGFVPLTSIKIDDYEEFKPDGFTALFDAVYSSVGATLDYAKDLFDEEFDSINAVCYCVTDGMNNRGTATPKMIRDKIRNALKCEELSSFEMVLVQLRDPKNPNPKADMELKKFREEAEIESFIDVKDVKSETLAKLGNIISKSISSHSNSTQTGSPTTIQSLSI